MLERQSLPLESSRGIHAHLWKAPQIDIVFSWYKPPSSARISGDSYLM
jgi:hypothetical protein